MNIEEKKKTATCVFSQVIRYSRHLTIYFARFVVQQKTKTCIHANEGLFLWHYNVIDGYFQSV